MLQEGLEERFRILQVMEPGFMLFAPPLNVDIENFPDNWQI
jgi:hypothetical protein